MLGTAGTVGYSRIFDQSVVHGGQACYQLIGGRLHTGDLYNVSSEVQQWSTSPYGKNGYLAYFSYIGVFPHGNAEAVRTYCFSVRCIRE